MRSRLKPVQSTTKISLHTAATRSAHKDRRHQKEDEGTFKKKLEKENKQPARRSDVLDIKSKEATPSRTAAMPKKLAGDPKIGGKIDLRT